MSFNLVCGTGVTESSVLVMLVYFLEHVTWCCWSMVPIYISVVTLVWRRTIVEVRLGHTQKYAESMALHHVERTGYTIVA